MTYLTPAQVLFIHSRRQQATFDAADLYPDLSHKAVALMELQ